jgi:hypothetical protein
MGHPVKITPHPTVLGTATRMGVPEEHVSWLAGLVGVEYPPKRMKKANPRRPAGTRSGRATAKAKKKT